MDTHSSEVIHHVALQTSWTRTQEPGNDASPIFNGIFFRVSIKPHLKPTIKTYSYSMEISDCFLNPEMQLLFI